MGLNLNRLSRGFHVWRDRLHWLALRIDLSSHLRCQLGGSLIYWIRCWISLWGGINLRLRLNLIFGDLLSLNWFLVKFGHEIGGLVFIFFRYGILTGGKKSCHFLEWFAFIVRVIKILWGLGYYFLRSQWLLGSGLLGLVLRCWLLNRHGWIRYRFYRGISLWCGLRSGLRSSLWGCLNSRFRLWSVRLRSCLSIALWLGFGGRLCSCLGRLWWIEKRVYLCRLLCYHRLASSWLVSVTFHCQISTKSKINK